MKKKMLNILLSFFIPIILLIICLLIMRYIYNTNKVLNINQFMVADMKYQYIGLFNYFKNVLHQNASIFYSFNVLMGNNMISTFSYYLSSPLNLLLVFSNTNNIQIFILLIIIIKFGLCGLLMNYYLRTKFKSNNNMKLLIFSTLYALMGYNIAYYFNVMWLDVVYLTPLVLLGIDQIVKGKKSKIYVIALLLAIISNFYIAYMLCIFCVIYFIYELVLNYSLNDKKKIIKCIKIFLMLSFLTALISSILLVPTIIDSLQFFRGNMWDSMFASNDIFARFITLLSKFYIFPQSNNNIISSYTPNVYAGILTILLTVLFFTSKVSKKEKIATLSVIIIFILSICVDALNVIWHGFTFPNGYAYRFSFLFSIFLIIVAFKSLHNLKHITMKKALLILCSVVLIGIIYIIRYKTNISYKIFGLIITMGLFTAYMLLLNVYVKYKNVGVFLILIAVLIEIVINTVNSSYTTFRLGYRVNYNNYSSTFCEVIDRLDNDEYRMDSKFMFGALESFICNEKRISGAITTNNKNIYNFFYKTGFNVTYSTVFNERFEPIINSLFGTKYYYNNISKDSFDSFLYNYNNKNKIRFYIHENENVLPIGYIIDKNYNKIFNKQVKSNPFSFQNALISSMTGYNLSPYKPYKVIKIDKNNYNVDVNNNNDMYFYIDYIVPENSTYFATINFNKTQQYRIEAFNSGITKINNIYNNKILKVNVNYNTSVYKKEPNIYMYYFDEEEFKKGINSLRESTLNVTYMNKNQMKGNINVKNEGTLFLSIPYEKGWNIYIDDKKVKYSKVYDAFIGINLKEGKHNIKMTFYSPGLKLGLVLSIIGAIVTYVYINISKLKTLIKKSNCDNIKI